MSHQIDDQAKAQDYQGQQVRVTGTLDGSNLIHMHMTESSNGK